MCIHVDCNNAGIEIDIAGGPVIPVFDPPHLLKGLRNNLLTKDLEITREDNTKEYASWSHIEMAYDVDIHACTYNRAMPKLTDQHVKPSKIRKMKVKHAAQVFSRTMSVFLQLASMWSPGNL